MKPSEWLNKMQDIWRQKTPDDMAILLADTLEYYEDPTQPPLTNRVDVVKEWQAVLAQNIEYY